MQKLLKLSELIYLLLLDQLFVPEKTKMAHVSERYDVVHGNSSRSEDEIDSMPDFYEVKYEL